MSLQEPYIPDSNFSDLGEATPSRLDYELANIATALQSTQALVTQLLRDDGRFKDGLIEAYQLSTEVRNLMVEGITPRGSWSTGTGYVIGDLVERDDDSYVCASVHTSSGNFDADRIADYWVVFSRALTLAPGVTLGTASAEDIGIEADDIPNIALADARYVGRGGGGLYYETVAGAHIIDPVGGAGRYSGTFTGAVELQFPQIWKNAHFRIILDILTEGDSATIQTESLSVIISGRADAGGESWHDVQAHLLDGTDAKQVLPIRFGDDDDGYMRIWLGELSAEWGSPKVKVREMFVGGAQQSAAFWVGGWGVAFVTAFEGGVSQVIKSAGVMQLPDFAGSGGKYLRVAGDELAVEYRTIAEVADDLGLVPEATQDGQGYLRYNGSWISIDTYPISLGAGVVNGTLELDGGIGGVAMIVRADSDNESDDPAEMPQLRMIWDANTKEWNAQPNAGGGLVYSFVGGTGSITLEDGGGLIASGTIGADTLEATSSVKVNALEVYHPGNKPSPTDLGFLENTKTINGHLVDDDPVLDFVDVGIHPTQVDVNGLISAYYHDGLISGQFIRSDVKQNVVADTQWSGQNKLIVGDGLNGKCHLSYVDFWNRAQIDSPEGSPLAIGANGSMQFQIGTATGNAVATGNWSSGGTVIGSDRNIKKNFAPIEDASEKLEGLHGQTYTLKRDGSNCAGLIAQDVEAVLPEAVSVIEGIPGTSKDHLGLNYNAVIGLLVEAVKEEKRYTRKIAARLQLLEE